MNGYLFYDEVGEIKSYMQCNLEEAELNADALGLRFIEGAAVHPALFQVLDGEVREKIPAGPAPVEYQELPEPVLAEVQLRRWESIKMQRDYFEHAGFDTPYGRFDSDQSSQMKLIGASMAAQGAPEDWSVTWTLQDNSAVSLNATDVMVVAQMLLQHVNAVHTIGRGLREQIFAEDATLEDVVNVAWPSY